MNWQISKIEISSFKAFKQVSLDIGTSSLLTLDGPNGYGKTSIFDAIELLLTGQIKRIGNLFSKVMTKGKRNYEDNLFWNIRSGEKDLVIKIEFYNGDRTLTLARYASSASLKKKELNRADSFAQFSLYELPNFSSTDFSSENFREDEYIEMLFGENFRENFCFLNYLEQGQNQLLLTKVDERKEALGNLFNITDITSEIDNCKSIERGLTRFLGDPERKSREQELTLECNSLRAMTQAEQGNLEYKKLSTIALQPGWDKENLFSTYSSEIFNQFIEATRKLLELLPLKGAVRIRSRNEGIETDIIQNMATLRSLAEFGTDTRKLNALDSLKTELDQLSKAKAILQRGSTTITIAEAESLPGWDADRLKWFEDQIATRNDLLQKSQSNATIAAELTHLKSQLLEEHAKLYPEGQNCPLCGVDWKSHQAMMKAVEDRALIITSSLSSDGKALVELSSQMTNELASIASHVNSRETILLGDYNEVLHTALNRERVRLASIEQMAERFQNAGTPIIYPFTANVEVREARLQDLITLMRESKTLESDVLPEDWKQIINSTFKDIQDFYLIEKQDLVNKNLYISAKASEARNNTLLKSIESLKKIRQENKAATNAKDKVNKLRGTLEKVEQTYADHTISEIELIFHIYSGRLIQNYQRGLGLFIESRDGKQLRFLTAEKSDHDAVLSMSSGQVSALSLAFFLSLNKVYARVPLILIDDPSQSLDEVNIASLTDLLRCELKYRQLIVSSHEEDISSYMRYRFTKAGLSTRSLNMQNLAKNVS